MSDWLVTILYQMKVDYVFGVPGGAIEPLYDALARAQKSQKIEVVTARHESGAAYMADGYYRETGKMGVVCATTGPGTTNLATGMATAAADGSKVLAITGQTAMRKFGRNALQDSSGSGSGLDTVAMFGSFMKHSALISHPEQVEHKVFQALHSILGKNGPGHLSIPSDILASSAVEFTENLPAQLRHQNVGVDVDAVAPLLSEIQHAKKIAIYIGHGC